MDVEAKIIKLTPTIAELLPDYLNTIICTEPGCSLVFHNKGQYHFHLTRHHKKEVITEGVTVYHCPAEKCIYHVDRLGGRSCASMRLIRQHYQKVHLKKNFVCECCGKSFLKANEMSRHQTNGSCGQVWQCAECGWEYGSREALMTHGKRKGHNYETDKNNMAKARKVCIPKNPKTFTKAIEPACHTSWNQSIELTKEPLVYVDQEQLMPITTMLNGQPTIVQETIIRPTLNDMVGMNIEVLLCNLETQPNNLLPDSTDSQLHGIKIDQEATTQTYPSLLYELSKSAEKCTQTDVKSEFADFALSNNCLTTLVCDIETQTDMETTHQFMSSVNLLPESTNSQFHSIKVDPEATTQTYPSLLYELSKSVEKCTQTDVLNFNGNKSELTEMNTLSNNSLTTLVCDIETQTDMETTQQFMTSVNNCTQTCDYILKSPDNGRNMNQTAELANAQNTEANCLPANMFVDFLVSTETQTNLELVDLPSLPKHVNQLTNDIETQTNRGDPVITHQELTSSYNSELQQINPTYTTMNTDDFLVSTETQTSFSQRLLNTDNFLTDMETQTKDQQLRPNMANCLRADDFLVSTETQTSYEQCLMDTELSLTDIETQTNWSYNNVPSQSFNTTSTPSNLLTNKASAKNTTHCDDFLVTAETQTNFGQCLLDTALESTTNSSDGLYNTQYTQTCDELLNELLFGDQENLQSSYTQT